MKQLFLFFFLLLSIPFHTSAISLQEIQNNPQQYQMIYQNAEYALFVDSDSIESLRYSPPYYTLKCTAYHVDYLQDVIELFTININYDISHRDFNPNKRKMSELGIYISDHKDGDISSPVYHIANYLFYKAYDEYYGPKFRNTLY